MKASADALLSRAPRGGGIYYGTARGLRVSPLPDDFMKPQGRLHQSLGDRFGRDELEPNELAMCHSAAMALQAGKVVVMKTTVGELSVTINSGCTLSVLREGYSGNNIHLGEAGTTVEKIVYWLQCIVLSVGPDAMVVGLS